MQLYIGNQNYSSWSLRAWLIFAQHDLNPDIIKLSLFSDSFYQTLQPVSPTAKVPLLIDGETTVWDSLAILEYINEAYLNHFCWPKDRQQRATARAIANEMHSGFMAIRNEMPMNCRASRKVSLSEEARKDIARIEQIWGQQMSQYPNQWLFGEWSIADAMFAPIALRFATYQIPLSKAATQYQKTVLNSPAIKQWLAQALEETEIVEEDEAGEPINQP
ncbi:glutathione S-transferase family protein [Vibrio methylphosphonaticus]|uniref:glutathione S-transferase family protein n=1 Tax=Vibrio methylphosphonaticus TaxID=2946866 RepID=UPI00202AA466|nr:glutathione S-transferase family protein [Vibrio methylphosphonaticus]MCL9774466.1 glutathione S-transferase family protein [Vibrio methylphosphonaticus]